MKAINLTYVTLHDAKDVHNFSGTEYYIAKALEKQPVHIDYIGNLRKRMNLSDLFLKRLYLSILPENGFLSERAISVAKNYAKQINGRMTPDTNVIFATSSIPVSMLNIKNERVRKVFYTDATFAAMLDYYPEFTNLGKYAIKQGNLLEQKALDNCDLAIYTSEWAAESAITLYNANPEKVKVVQRGAGIETYRTKDEVEKIIQAKSKNECNLLFTGIDWQRKGGNITLDTAKILHDHGIKVHLDIVGIRNLSLELPEYVTNHGFISKSTDEGRKKLDDLFSKAHFLVLPTRAECMAIVYCEASSYGLPSLTTNTGGVASAIRDNINGKLFQLSDEASKYAEYIEHTLADFKNYQKMCFSSYNEYQTRLNWDVAGEKIIQFIENLL